MCSVFHKVLWKIGSLDRIEARSNIFWWIPIINIGYWIFGTFAIMISIIISAIGILLEKIPYMDKISIPLSKFWNWLTNKNL